MVEKTSNNVGKNNKSYLTYKSGIFSKGTWPKKLTFSHLFSAHGKSSADAEILNVNLKFGFLVFNISITWGIIFKFL